ncbi:13580_t:CDS:2, partial [Acaulospora morrowiae]
MYSPKRQGDRISSISPRRNRGQRVSSHSSAHKERKSLRRSRSPSRRSKRLENSRSPRLARSRSRSPYGRRSKSPQRSQAYSPAHSSRRRSWSPKGVRLRSPPRRRSRSPAQSPRRRSRSPAQSPRRRSRSPRNAVDRSLSLSLSSPKVLSRSHSPSVHGRQDKERDGEKSRRRLTSRDSSPSKANNEKAQEIVKPNFGLSGKLAAESNKFNGVALKYQEPPEARKPTKRWRLYVFKKEEQLANSKSNGVPSISYPLIDCLHIHRQSAYLLGRDRNVADIPIDHPSCSSQHA